MPVSTLLRSPEPMLYALFATTAACVLLLCWLPRALAPIELPSLQLDPALVAAVEDADRAALVEAPQTPTARALQEKFLELGAIENHTSEGATTAKQQRQMLARTYDKLVRESGIPAALALRSAAVERLEAALRLQLPEAETERVLGLFPEALERHGVTRDGIELAPHFVLRTLYKARWNLAMGLTPDYRFAPVELRAYHGWLALHTTHFSPAPRSAALQQYGAADGGHVAEARGALAFLAHDYKQAVAALEAAYQETPSLRLRNWLRGASVAVSAMQAGP